MKSKKCISQFVLLLIFGLTVLLCCSTEASAAIAKISGFTGKALLHSGADIMLISRIGQEINVGDFVQTENGEAEITFNDGAMLKVSPYTKTMIQEASEESGAWIFKTIQATRRLTCFVGKLWFKSGSSNRRLMMQSPTAVVGIRGSEGDFGFNPDPARLQTFLNIYVGEVVTVAGSIIRGFFENPGITAAQKSTVYQQLETAYARVVATAAANAAPNVSENQKTLNDANARLAALDVAKQAATILIQSNPDAVVRNQAQAAIAVIDPMITNNQALAAQARTGITGPTTEITTTVLPALPTTVTTTTLPDLPTTVTTTTLTTGATTIPTTTTTIAPSPLTTIWTTTSTTSTPTTVTPSR